MKKTVLTAVALMVAVVVLSLVNFSAAPVEEAVVSGNENKVITVSNSEKADESKVLEARFLNMLNHSYVYNEDFQTIDGVVNNSVIALLSYAEDGYIPENIVSDYIFNMYGVEIDDYSVINPEFEYKEGYVFILPKGYSTYKHSIVSALQNEDGSYTVKTKVEISSHDSGVYTEECETLFVQNAESQFGFSIIYSNIGTEAIAI